MHFARFEDQPEDLATSEYLRDTALQAGLAGKPIAVPQIGWNGQRFTDPDEMPIRVMGKLYPWEWMVREEFGAHVLSGTTAFIEPAWKMILSQQDAAAAPVGGLPRSTRTCCPRSIPSTPIWAAPMSRSRCSAAKATTSPSSVPACSTPPPGLRCRRLCLSGLPAAAGVRRQPCGRRLLGDRGPAAGIGMREDERRITHNNSRFVPHYFEPVRSP